MVDWPLVGQKKFSHDEYFTVSCGTCDVLLPRVKISVARNVCLYLKLLLYELDYQIYWQEAHTHPHSLQVLDNNLHKRPKQYPHTAIFSFSSSLHEHVLNRDPEGPTTCKMRIMWSSSHQHQKAATNKMWPLFNKMNRQQLLVKNIKCKQNHVCFQWSLHLVTAEFWFWIKYETRILDEYVAFRRSARDIFYS